jgi:hypothetical protein
MTVRYIPNTGNNALFFVSAGRGVLYLLDSLAGTVSETYDANVGDGHCVMTLPFRNSSRIMMSIYTSDQVRVGCASARNWDAQKALPRGGGCAQSARVNYAQGRRVGQAKGIRGCSTVLVSSAAGIVPTVVLVSNRGACGKSQTVSPWAAASDCAGP